MNHKALFGCNLISLILAVPLHADDWPRWRGPNHDGISREAGWSTAWPDEGPKELWRKAIGTGFATVSVSQGRLFTGGNSDETDTIFALDAENGREIWKHAYACRVNLSEERYGPAATPTVEGER